MHEQNYSQNILNSLAPEELNALRERFPILSRTDPVQALELFRNQQTATPPSVRSPFVQSARKGRLPPKVTSGK